MKKGADGLVFPPATAQSRRSNKRKCMYTDRDAPHDTPVVPSRTSSRTRKKRVIQEAKASTPINRGPGKKHIGTRLGELAGATQIIKPFQAVKRKLDKAVAMEEKFKIKSQKL